MEWIRISSNKLKIMLTAADAERYALRFENVDYADTVTRRAFKDILTDVKRETGFDATEDKVYIQLYPSREGGCELFVTKTGILMTDADSGDHIHTKEAAGSHDPFSLPPRRRMALCFSSMERMLAVCRRLLARHYRGESEAWKDDSHSFWLFLSEEGDPLKVQEDYMFIAEYGKIENAESATLLLPEHGNRICEKRAVETLGLL